MDIQTAIEQECTSEFESYGVDQELAAPIGSQLGQRIFDLAMALAILAFAAPFLLLLALIMYLNDPGPLFFVHRRIGYGGRFFGCLKFRTMKMNGDVLLREHLALCPQAREEWNETQKLKDDPRVTRVGAVVRKLSLDEFPQLINVLRGEMSIVGPRPIVGAEIPRYAGFFTIYCSVKPGLTGLWQVSGRNDTPYDTRVQLDMQYIARKNLATDMWIVIKTVPAVLLARGSY